MSDDMDEDVITVYPEYEDWQFVTPDGDVVVSMRGDVISGDSLALRFINGAIMVGIPVGVGVTIRPTPRMVTPLMMALTFEMLRDPSVDPPFPEAWRGLKARRLDGRAIPDVPFHTYWSDRFPSGD